MRAVILLPLLLIGANLATTYTITRGRANPHSSRLNFPVTRDHGITKRSLSNLHYGGGYERNGLTTADDDEFPLSEEDLVRELLRFGVLRDGPRELLSNRLNYEVEDDVDDLPEVSWANPYEDLTGEEDGEPNSDNEEEYNMSRDDDLKQMSGEEVNTLLSLDPEVGSQHEKKNINWMPQANDIDISKKSGIESTSVVKEDGNVVPLSAEQVNHLLSDTDSTKVNSVSDEIHLESVNGKEKATEKKVYDVTTKGHENHVIEVDETYPKGKALEAMEEAKQKLENDEEELTNEVQQEVDDVDDILKQLLTSGHYRTVKRKRSEDNLPYRAKPTGQLQEALAKRCLLKYIALEDAENSDLAEALSWATKSQIEEDNGEALDEEINILSKAVQRELALQTLGEECRNVLDFGLEMSLSELDDLEELQNKVAEDELDDTDDDNGEVQAREVDETYLSPDEIDDLKALLKQRDLEDSPQRPQLDPSLMVYQEAQDENTPDWYVNPFTRKMVYTNRQPTIKRSSNYGNDCPALNHLTNDCAAIRNRGVVMDDEALVLCTRHQLCYNCGAAIRVSAETCDVNFLQQAHSLCSLGDGSARVCRDTTRDLFYMMTDAHAYNRKPNQHCVDNCVIDAMALGSRR